MALGERVAKLRAAQVWVAVHAAAGDVRDRVDDRGIGQLRPCRLGEVERVNVRERLRAALGGLLAQAFVDLLLGHSLKLAVVVEQTHR